ncbi:PREDICTED: uncharacterized protein LOC100631641 [Amphimedon queenslandica]|uniref:Uncharacterized protein n=1 Tax=Amphimedon queenslandica TaxID=400682 RepID=A0A1X7VQ38_AMPQE|nr:PREDICTED: uncharacterized protein LOC100631641 [Amphimedon queenslandica]|eukprot:XP_019857707.1 PREDICTED: uncharacterized protein LOC100631641 [Amphimedon queenslandica]
MEKDNPVAVLSELCTDADISRAQRVLPSKFLKLGDIVSASTSISSNLSKELIFPYVDCYQPEGYPLNPLPTKSVEKLPPIALSVDGKAAPVYGNNNPSFADVNSTINRSVFAAFSANLPNQAVITQEQKPVLNLDQWGKEERVAAAKFFEEFLCSSKSNNYFRSCPGGRGQTGGGGASGGASGGNGTTGDVQWVTGSYGGGGGSYYGGSGGDDDDDPSKHLRQINNTPGHYLDLDLFQASEDLDPVTADLLREFGLFSELGLEPVFNPHLQNLPGSSSGVNVRPDDYSDPAPQTPHTPAPMTPHTPAPATPASYGMMSPMPQCGASGMNYGPSLTYGSFGGAYESMGGASMQSTSGVNVSDLLEMSKLMATPVTPPTNNPVCAPMVVPQQPRNDQRLTGQQVFNLTHPSASNSVANVGLNPPPSPSPQSQTSFALSQPVTQFFGVRPSYINAAQGKKVLKVFVKDHNNAQSYDALKFCFDMFKKYDSQLEKQCTLPIANQGRAKLATMTTEPDSSLTFSMPFNCLPFDEWAASNNDLRACVLVLQQIVNTLYSVFQGDRDLSFWGSYQIFVAPNSQVYIYIDFNKSLSVQKVYATELSLQQSNSRNEDCVVLKNICDVLLNKFLNGGNVSPQLEEVLRSFGNLLNSPNCVSQVDILARILGQRRVCKMQATVHGLNSPECTVYSVEHEPVSQSLGVLKPYVNNVGPCAVYHSDGTPVHVTEISVRGSKNHQFILVPCGQNTTRSPGFLYIE